MAMKRCASARREAHSHRNSTASPLPSCVPLGRNAISVFDQPPPVAALGTLLFLNRVSRERRAVDAVRAVDALDESLHSADGELDQAVDDHLGTVMLHRDDLVVAIVHQLPGIERADDERESPY